MIVIAPQISFLEIAQRVAAIGWQPQADLTAPPSILPDEPDMATWVHLRGDRLFYTFHPAMYLRVLMVEGIHAEQLLAELSEHLPTLTVHNAEQLMQSLEIESILLGLAVAEVLEAIDLLDSVAALIEHPDQLIAQEANRVFQRLLSKATIFSTGLVAEWQAKHPDHSVIFRMLGSVQERRQVLRQLMQSTSHSNPTIDATLRTALEDLDWEVRITAILAAARLQAVAVRTMVHQVKLPDSTAEGLDAIDRRILVTLRQVALTLLQGQQPPPQSDCPLTTKEAMQAHIMRCILGLPVTWHDRTFLFIHALTQPIAPAPDLDALPSGVERVEDSYRFQQIPLVWVAPIAHWLGDDRLELPIPNPIRQVKPTIGFLMSRNLISGGQLLEFSEANNQPARVTWQMATEWCNRQSNHFNLAFRLPTPDEWEMAARGTDGRRFPWGNGLEKEWHTLPSPWGIQDSMGVLEQWTNALSAPDRPIVCGKLTKLGCAGRRIADANDSTPGFRIVIERS